MNESQDSFARSVMDSVNESQEEFRRHLQMRMRNREALKRAEEKGMGKVFEHRHNRSRVAFMAGTSPTPDTRVTSGDALSNTSSTRHGADGVKKRSSSRDSSRGSSRPTSEGHKAQD